MNKKTKWKIEVNLDDFIRTIIPADEKEAKHFIDCLLSLLNTRKKYYVFTDDTGRGKVINGMDIVGFRVSNGDPK